MVPVFEEYHRHNSWVKELIKAHSTEVLAKLIRSRIESPGKVGPYYDEKWSRDLPTTIINSYVASEDEARKKIGPAVGLLLFEVLKEEIPETTKLIRGIFDLIQESNLGECRRLLQTWLKRKASVLASTDAVKEEDRLSYRDGLMAFARIQPPNDALVEHYWANLWKEGQPFWWATAFYGMRVQNPKLACYEFSTLIDRNVEHNDNLLYGTWMDKTSSPIMERALKKALKENQTWCGLAIQKLTGKLTTTQKDHFLDRMKST